MNSLIIAKKIAAQILAKYSKVGIYYDRYDDDNEIFILIDDVEVFESAEYRKFISNIRKNFSYVFFSFISSKDELTKNAIDLKFENIKEELIQKIVKNTIYMPSNRNTLSNFLKSMQHKLETKGLLNEPIKQDVSHRPLKPFTCFTTTLSKSIDMDQKIMLYKKSESVTRNTEHFKITEKHQIVPNGMFKPFMGFGALPLSMNIDEKSIQDGKLQTLKTSSKGDIIICQNNKSIAA